MNKSTATIQLLDSKNLGKAPWILDVPDDVPASQLIKTIASDLGLPLFDDDGLRIVYNLEHQRRRLDDDDTLRNVGITDRSVLRLETKFARVRSLQFDELPTLEIDDVKEMPADFYSAHNAQLPHKEHDRTKTSNSSNNANVPPHVTNAVPPPPPDPNSGRVAPKRPRGMLLYIKLRREVGRAPYLEFSLFVPTAQPMMEPIIGRTPFPDDLKTYAVLLHRQLNGLTNCIDPSSGPYGGLRCTLTNDERYDLIRAIGNHIWASLVPDELKARYNRDRVEWRGDFLQIISDETCIPWELVWPYGDGWNDEDPWCGTFRMTRWLHDIPTAPTSLPFRSPALVLPDDSELPAIRREHEMMTRMASDGNAKAVYPDEPTFNAVKQLIGSGKYDWMHIACHGAFHPAQPYADIALWIYGRPLTPVHLAEGRIVSHIKKEHPCFVINACEASRQGSGLTGFGDWVERLVGAGAGMLIGPLWEVGDEAALSFVEELYTCLLKDANVAEAVREARLKSRRKGDPTWLAYTVYAHPNARLVIDSKT